MGPGVRRHTATGSQLTVDGRARGRIVDRDDHRAVLCHRRLDGLDEPPQDGYGQLFGDPPEDHATERSRFNPVQVTDGIGGPQIEAAAGAFDDPFGLGIDAVGGDVGCRESGHDGTLATGHNRHRAGRSDELLGHGSGRGNTHIGEWILHLASARGDIESVFDHIEPIVHAPQQPDDHAVQNAQLIGHVPQIPIDELAYRSLHLADAGPGADIYIDVDERQAIGPVEEQLVLLPYGSRRSDAGPGSLDVSLESTQRGITSESKGGRGLDLGLETAGVADRVVVGFGSWHDSDATGPTLDQTAA